MSDYSIYIMLFISYVIGSIPSAVWIGKTFHGIDVREHGSGNAGATNTFRVLGKKAGTIVLCIDIVKGFLAVLLAHLIVEDISINFINYQLLLGTAAVLGHVFPLFAKFKGGKGVATLLGLMFGIHPLGSLLCLIIFLVILITSKYVSLSSIIGCCCFPFMMFFWFKETDNFLPYFGIIVSVLLIVTHKKNIKRLLAGNENKTFLFGKF